MVILGASYSTFTYCISSGCLSLGKGSQDGLSNRSRRSRVLTSNKVIRNDHLGLYVHKFICFVSHISKHRAEKNGRTAQRSTLTNLPPSSLILDSTRKGIVSTALTASSSALVKQVASRPAKMDLPLVSVAPTNALYIQRCFPQWKSPRKMDYQQLTQDHGKQPR